MDEDESLRRFGLHPAGADVQCRFPRRRTPCLAGQGTKLDAHCSIDIQLLRGVGLQEAIAYLTVEGFPDAVDRTGLSARSRGNG